MRMISVAAAFAALAFTPATVSAVTVVEAAGELDAFSFSVEGTKITIEETWGAETSAFVYLLFDGLEPGVDYTVHKILTNNTARDWPNFEHELGFGTPDDFLSSPNTDGLSFAQSAMIPRVSDGFDSVLVDELDDRDFLKFFDGSVGFGETVTFSYGLRADVEDNNPFLLKQGVIPEPATWAMLIVGFGLVGFAARRRQATVTA